jgi:hypothetical protein
MRHAQRSWMAIAALGLALLTSAAPRAEAGTTDVDQVYFEATIAKGGDVLSRPQALVKVGAKAVLGMRASSATGPRFGLQYVVDQPANADMTATVTGLVDGHEVAIGTLHFPSDGGQAVAMTLEGGGYTWQFNAEPVSTETIARRRSERRQR